MRHRNRIGAVTLVAGSLWAATISGSSLAQSPQAMDSDKARIVEHWTVERRAAAIPRDLVIDPCGLGYLRRSDGTLVPYGHEIAASGVQSVTFKLQKGPSGTVQSFAAVKSSTPDTWSLALSGFTDGEWT